MSKRIALVSLVVADYDEAIEFYTQKFGFELIEDTAQPGKRWVVVAPRGDGGCHLLLAKAKNAAERSAIGNQTGGRVFLFLETDDFDKDYQEYLAAGIKVVRPKKVEEYGKVAVFEDIYGNMWDLIERPGS
ncbi:VOC family protein [Kordiimonas gwangyangensis]|uniref:VOC family protein n=1 Tax=Kordiimonas gwangyangensis TaxID=288022 RepID=UPI00037859AA|nr:VOC family protein [Kordiimonas gwangyangensis]